MRRFVLCLFFVGRLTAVAAEGNEVGNGGGGVLCSGELRLLDYYAAELLLGLPVDLGDQSLDEREKVEWTLKRLERLDKPRAERYRREAQAFFGDALFVDDALLPATNDFGEVPLPQGCRIVQICVQRPKTVPEEKRYLIQRDLWGRLSVDHRAGLILHEILYKEALSKGHKDSRMTRYLNALVSSSRIETLTQAEYDERIEKSGFGSVTGPLAPLWAADPIRLPGVPVDTLYETSLAKYLIGTRPITIHKREGPSWLYLGFDGTLKVRPPVGETGTVRLKVRAVGPTGQAADATVLIPILD